MKFVLFGSITLAMLIAKIAEYGLLKTPTLRMSSRYPQQKLECGVKFHVGMQLAPFSSVTRVYRAPSTVDQTVHFASKDGSSRCSSSSYCKLSNGNFARLLW